MLTCTGSNIASGDEQCRCNFDDVDENVTHIGLFSAPTHLPAPDRSVGLHVSVAEDPFEGLWQFLGCCCPQAQGQVCTKAQHAKKFDCNDTQSSGAFLTA